MNSTTGEVMTLLRDRGPTSRAELARAIGISAAALTKITAGLISSGRVSELEEPVSNGLGRPPVSIALNADSGFLVGAHLGAGRVGLVATDLLLNPMERSAFIFDPRTATASEIIERVGREINRLIDQTGLPRQRFHGVGATVPGAVDQQGRFSTYSSYPNWLEAPVADRIEEIVGLPAVVENNATAIALASARFGVGRDSEATLYVYMRSGIGAGLAHSAHASRFPNFRAQVEIGHIVLDPHGAVCRCGARGCLETVFSEQPILDRLSLDGIPPNGLIAAAMQSPDIWGPLYDSFLRALSSTITLLMPDIVVLGGHLGEAPDKLFADLRRDLPERLMPQVRQKLRVERSGLGSDAGAKGAACVGLEKFVYAPGGR